MFLNNNFYIKKKNQDHGAIAKGVFLSLLVISSTIPFFLMVPEATPVVAEPSVTDTITGLPDARDIAYDPVHGRMYVTGVISQNVYIIDVNTNTETSDSPINIPSSVALHRIAYDPEHERMYITDINSNNVFVIDTNTNTQVTGTPINMGPVGSASDGIAYNPDNQMIYVSSSDGNVVKIVDTDTNTVNPTPISLTAGFGQPLDIEYDPDHQRMYVTRANSPPTDPSIVDIIDTTTNALDTTNGPVPVGTFPFSIAYDAVHQTMYVTHRMGTDVSVIDTTTTPNMVDATLTGQNNHIGISYDPVNDRMYVVENIGRVRVIDTTTNPPSFIGDPIPVGANPFGIAYDPEHGRMYVANEGSNSVSVIQITTATTTIDSATDGNNNPVTDGGTTVSDEITFTFTGTATPPTTVESFECSIDGSAFIACTSPHTLTGLSPGGHTFAVRVVDNDGNRQVPPTTFTWTVEEEIDPVTAIQDLISDIRSLNGVNFGVKISLITQLRLALIFVSDNNPSNDFISCALMTSFTTSVNTLQTRGFLTEAQATDLLQQAQAIQNAIGCNIGALSAATSTEADGTDTSPFSSSGIENDNPILALSLPY